VPIRIWLPIRQKLRNIVLKPEGTNMAEGLLEGVLGGEEKKIDPTVSGAEPLAAAIATSLANQSPEVAAETVAFLRQQTKVLRLQEKNLDAEYVCFESEAGPRLLALRLRTGFQLFFALITTVIGLALAIAIYAATQSRSVVIEPFEISSIVASEVPNGRIVAAGLLDQITMIQANTRLYKSSTSDLAAAWSQEASLVIPEVGLSLNQIDYFLRQKLGHDVHISGDVVRASSDRIALTVRGLDVIPMSFVGSPSDLNALLQQAAEYLYGEANIIGFSRYLDDKREYRREVDYLQSHISKAPKNLLPELLNGLALALQNDQGRSTYPQQKSLYEQAIRIAPKLATSYDNLAMSFAIYGEEERAVPVIQNALNQGIKPSDLQSVGLIFYDLELFRTFYEEDIASSNGTGATEGGKEQFLVAQFNALQHDTEAAKQVLNSVPMDAQSVDDIALYFPAAAFIAAEDGDLQGAIESWDRSFKNSEFATWVNNVLYIRSCLAAVDYQRADMPAKADAALDAPKRIMGADTYVDCYRSRGDVLELRGDWKAAQEWYAKAVNLAPSLPAGYYSWGVALEKHGDLAGAAEKLRLANQKGPHWADPLKAWGDVLVKQGNTKEALTKYDEALKYAPNWKQLKAARKALAKQKT
jgi:tetratricopeptide (TPR) repeat protein